MSEANRRPFELPGIEELSKEQEAINYLPADGIHLVIGGPGTGKSILALMRARLLAEQGREYRFLVYNVLLDHSGRQLFPGVRSRRWIGWFGEVYKSWFQVYPPRNSKAWEDIAWNQVQEQLITRCVARNASPLQGRYLIVDEGQDMPPQFYETLLLLGAKNIFVTADPNQSIGEFNSRWDELQTVLGVDETKIHHLSENFRQRHNGYHIARLAQAFYTDPGAKPLTLPTTGSTSTETPWLYAYNRPGRPFEDIIRRIIKRAQRKPSELIGILTPNNKVRKDYLQALGWQKNGITNPDGVPISTYRSKLDWQQVDAIRFDHGGILVINAQSCKGLEFDTVFIADIDQFPDWPESEQTRRLFYVMISRARERLFLLRDGDRTQCPVEDLGLLPTDPTLLQRNKNDATR